MNYRHAYHAGNFADVLKHATLALILHKMAAKPAPLRVIDTHAGPGRYDLTAPEPIRTREWVSGIARLLAVPIPDDIAPLLAPYLSAIAPLNPAPLSAATLAVYPGSPLVARHLLRPDDRLLVNELHPDDNAALARLLAGERRAKVLALDGWTALKAALPPKERRGVVLIDPPFEVAGEWTRLVEALGEAARRFAGGIVVLWYPIKDPQAVATFRRAVVAGGLDRLLEVELHVGPSADGDARSSDTPGLGGCGLLIRNPPYELDGDLARLVPWLATCLARGPGACGGASWLVPERSSYARQTKHL